MSRPPTIKHGPASHYAMDGERIMEIHSSKARKGALISIRDTGDDELVIEIYRADRGVFVRAGNIEVDATQDLRTGGVSVDATGRLTLHGAPRAVQGRP